MLWPVRDFSGASSAALRGVMPKQRMFVHHVSLLSPNFQGLSPNLQGLNIITEFDPTPDYDIQGPLWSATESPFISRFIRCPLPHLGTAEHMPSLLCWQVFVQAPQSRAFVFTDPISSFKTLFQAHSPLHF